MATAVTQPVAIPIGTIKSFGPWGPEYEVLGPASPENGQQMIKIVIVRTGEETTYEVAAMLEDPEA